jgi:phosphoketolase
VTLSARIATQDYAVQVEQPAATSHEATRVLGTFLRGVIRLNPRTFRVVGPDRLRRAHQVPLAEGMVVVPSSL